MIGIVGGSGDFGRGLAERLRRIGEEVVIGSRTPRDDFVSNVEASIRSEVIFLSVPPGGVERMSTDLARDLAGRIVVSVASPVVFVGGKAGAAPDEISLAEVTALAAPEARVVAGFHTVSAKLLGDPDKTLDEDVLVCGDDADAKALVLELAERITAGRALDCGPLASARTLEGLTAVIVNVNKRYKAHAGVRVTGVRR